MLRTFYPELLRPVFWKCLWITAVSTTAAVCLNGLLTELALKDSVNVTGIQLPVKNLLGTATSNTNINGSSDTDALDDDFSISLNALLYACGFFLTECCRSLCHTNFWWNGTIAGLKIRSSMRMLILRRTLSMSTSQSNTGQAMNFITNFSERIYHAAYYGVFLVSAPATLIVAIALAINVIGYAALAGFAVLVSVLVCWLLVVTVMMTMRIITSIVQASTTLWHYIQHRRNYI